MSKRYELVVFDWDGTLMDSEARIVSCMQRAAADAGKWGIPAVDRLLTQHLKAHLPKTDEKAVNEFCKGLKKI